MFMTTDSGLRGYRYRVIRMVVGGCYPFAGGPSISGIENAYQAALADLAFQAAFWDANAVIGVRTIQSDQFFVLVSGTAIWIDDARYHTPQPKQEQERSQWPGHGWGYVWEWMKDFWWL